MILELIADLAARGLADKVLVGGDTGRASMMRAYQEEPGLDYVFGGSSHDSSASSGRSFSDRIFVRNPAQAFAFAAEPRLSGGSSSRREARLTRLRRDLVQDRLEQPAREDVLVRGRAHPAGCGPRSPRGSRGAGGRSW